jgi:transcriptional regulator with XRE-family HTH domain
LSQHTSTYLRDLREEKEYSTRQLAQLSGCSQSLIAAIENDRRLPGMKRLWQLVRVLDGDFGRALFYLCLDLGIPESEIRGLILDE